MDIHELPRQGYSSLTVHRDRGVLWVCDISSSSSFINSDDLAEHIEAFLPRLHWVSSLAIQAIHGELIQWTGDGFIAWFPLEVERQLGRTCNRILEAIWHFTAFINITQLCVDSPRPFRIRHGLTYEPDALVTLTTHQDGHVSKIISGRNVVLAFRIAGVEADFPNVATQQKIRIRLKAYDHEVIDQSARKIVDTATRTGAKVAGPVPLPTERSVYCVIRSPHKDKDSREHFEMRTHKR